jgi:hypothetical protein
LDQLEEAIKIQNQEKALEILAELVPEWKKIRNNVLNCVLGVSFVRLVLDSFLGFDCEFLGRGNFYGFLA